MKKQETTASIILRHQAGDLKAFPLLEARYAHFLFTYCLKYRKDPDDAKDACQEIWIIVLAIFLKDNYIDEDNFKGWLRVTAFRYFAKQKPIIARMEMINDETLCEGSDEQTDAAIIDQEILVKIEKLLPQLPERWQLLITLKLFRNAPWEVIARFLNIKARTPDKEKAKSLSKEYSRIITALQKRFL